MLYSRERDTKFHIPKEKRSEFKDKATSVFLEWLDENTATYEKEVRTENYISKDIMEVEFVEAC